MASLLQLNKDLYLGMIILMQMVTGPARRRSSQRCADLWVGDSIYRSEGYVWTTSSVAILYQRCQNVKKLLVLSQMPRIDLKNCTHFFLYENRN